jgi:UDP-glucose 4-epimerase
VDAAANLARAARAAGARQFVLISTAHVHGRVAAGMVTDTTAPNPMDGYAASKLAAEDAVREAFGAPVTIIRPVAVIGPHCPGNLQLLMKCLVRRVPLPLAAIQNQRSFIHRDDLAQLVLLAAAAPPQTVLAAHPAAISTPDLLRALAAGLGLAPHLWPAPLSLLGLAASLAGRGAMWQSLAGSFIAAPRAAQAMGWEPAQTLAESLTETARYYHTTRQTA